MSEIEAPKDVVLKGKVIVPVLKYQTLGGWQYVYRFDNGYGASIINHRGSYGVEMCVIEWDHCFDDHDDYTLCYTTPVAGDVLGWLTFDELILKLGEVQGLPFKPGSNKDVFGILN